MVTTALNDGGVKAALFRWAVRWASCGWRSNRPANPFTLLALQHELALKVVFRKIQQRLGGRIRVLVSGAAPLSKDIAMFFAAAGLPILEGYGLTEQRGELRQPARCAQDRHGGPGDRRPGGQDRR